MGSCAVPPLDWAIPFLCAPGCGEGLAAILTAMCGLPGIAWSVLTTPNSSGCSDFQVAMLNHQHLFLAANTSPSGHCSHLWYHFYNIIKYILMTIYHIVRCIFFVLIFLNEPHQAIQ